MKNYKIKVGLGGLLAIAALTTALFTTGSIAADVTAKGGATQLMNQIKTPADAEALKPGDSIAMVCTKCKSVMVHNVTTEKGHVKTMTVGEKHMCSGCNSTITVVGRGKGPGGARDEVKHVCEKCGDDSVFCCSTKPGSGATKGMQK